MDQKRFEEILTSIGRWVRITPAGKEDPDNISKHIEIRELHPRTYDCDWCNGQCNGNRSYHKVHNFRFRHLIWKYFCNTCGRYYDPREKKVSENSIFKTSRLPTIDRVLEHFSEKRK